MAPLPAVVPDQTSGSIPSAPVPATDSQGGSGAVDPAWKTITSPMVGTFYRSPGPGEPPFVAVGDSVAAGASVCIVEAMKLMNEIAMEEDGIIRKIELEDASTVEFGTILFYYETE